MPKDRVTWTLQEIYESDFFFFYMFCTQISPWEGKERVKMC